MKLDSNLDFEDIGSKYSCKMFTRINDVEKKHGTMDFKNKRDLNRFVTSENVVKLQVRSRTWSDTIIKQATTTPPPPPHHHQQTFLTFILTDSVSNSQRKGPGMTL